MSDAYEENTGSHEMPAAPRPANGALMPYLLAAVLGLGGGAGTGLLTGGSNVTALEVRVDNLDKELDRVRATVDNVATKSDITDLKEDIRDLKRDIRRLSRDPR